MLKRLLTTRGYVLEADRGLLALRRSRASPRLIVLDAMLPEVHGFEIARRIRKQALRPSDHHGQRRLSGWRYART